jgi:hypothetical protein
MKTTPNIIALLLCILLTSCVQKTYKRTVVYTLDVSKIKNIKKVGIRGNDKPLSWDNDTEMKEIKKDSLYQTTITTNTGYKFTEVKFVVNEQFELENKENRRVIFDAKKDTTKVFFTFDKK